MDYQDYRVAVALLKYHDLDVNYVERLLKLNEVFTIGEINCWLFKIAQSENKELAFYKDPIKGEVCYQGLRESAEKLRLYEESEKRQLIERKEYYYAVASERYNTRIDRVAEQKQVKCGVFDESGWSGRYRLSINVEDYVVEPDEYYGTWQETVPPRGTRATYER